MKRTWTLLLAVLVLAMVLAVPAMAADNTHTAGSHPTGTWNQLTSGTTELTESKYYLAGNITASITKTSGDIVICLNGKTWEGDGACPLAVTAGSVTICDCGSGGQMKGYDYGGATGNGGAVNVASGASFTLESGTITGGRAKNGGNIYSAGTVTIQGGTVSAGEAGKYDANGSYAATGYSKGWGGNIYSTGTLNISGGTVSSGKSGGNGGNVYNTGALNMTDGTVTSGDSRDNGGNIFTSGNMSLTGGTVTLGTARNGGNISANANGKTLVLSGVKITNGTCCGTAYAGTTGINANAGANVRIFETSPASVTIGDGTEITGGQSNATNGSKNIYIGINTTKYNTHTSVTIGSATIDGNVYISDGSPVTLTGAPSITGSTINLRIDNSTLTAANITGGTVGITATGDARAFSAAGTSAYAAYFSADSGSELGVAYHDGGTNMWLGVKYCICGASKTGSDNHVQFTDAAGNTVGCDKTDLVWLPWTADHVTYAKKTGFVYKTGSSCKVGLPVSGNYYLDGDVATSGQTYTEAGASGARAALNIDLNGHKITTGTNRGFTLSAYSTLSITDTAGGGQVINTANHDQGGIAWLSGGYSVFNLYGGKMDATKFSSRGSNDKGGAAVDVSSGSAKFYMFGGELYGSRVDDPSTAAVEGFTASATTSVAVGAATSSAGGYKSRLPAFSGPVTVSGNGAHAYIFDGTIYGGTVQFGECMSTTASSKITSTKTAGGNGAAISVLHAGAVVDIYGGTIVGGKAIGATASATAADGTTTEATGGGKGGAIYSVGTLNIYGGSITGGTDGNGNANCVYADEGTINVYPLADGSEIEVYASEAGVFGNVTSAVTLADKACFTSDNSDYIVSLTANGLELVAKDAHVHCPCNGTVGNADNGYTHTLSGHVCREVVYAAADSADALAAGGSFYLTGNITGSITPAANLDMCLHGQTWNPGDSARPLTVNSGITVSIADCDGAGTVNGYSYTIDADSKTYGGTAYVSGVLNLYNGKLVGGNAYYGTNLSIHGSSGKFNMFGGTLDGGGNTTPGNGGNVRIDGTSSYMYMYGGLITGGKTGDQGGNIYCAGYMYLYGGSVTDGEALAKNGGGNIAINSSKAVVLQGVTVTGGKAVAEGGNIRISSTQSAGSLTVGAGTYISGGQAKNGGNIYVANNNYNVTSGTRLAALNITGGTIENGVVTDNSATANIYAVCTEKTGVTTVVNLKFSGGTVKGGVYAEDGTAVTLSGAPVIDGGDDCQSNLELCSNKLAVNANLSANARVFISCADAANGTVVAESITDGTDVSGIYYHGSQYALYYDAVAGTLSLGQPGAALINGDLDTVYPTLQAAIEAAGDGDYVRLVADYTGDALEVGTLYLDLNGFDITSNITTSGTLYLFDSKTADYSVKVGEELTGFGTVTGTITGNVARAFTTSAIKANYENHNYRYMVVCLDGVYSSHRIYLTVKSTILYPQTPALNYRTILRCNEYMAELINTQGGYGVLLESYRYDSSAANNQGALSHTYGDYVEAHKTVLPYREENGVVVQENNRVTHLTNILDTANKNSAANQYKAAANVKARAYIWIEDDLNGAESKTGAEILQHGICSSGVNYSLKSLILSANSDSKWALLTDAQKIALGGMYGMWKELMESWDLHNIATMEDVTVRYGCVCGDPNSTDNPCAEKGHIEFAWEPTNTLPTTSGNYYLTGTVSMSDQVTIPEGAMINLNTCGYSITTTDHRMALVKGVFNLTNYNYDGTTATVSLVTGDRQPSGGNGGVFLIQSTGNVSIYDNITVQVAADAELTSGVIAVGGSLNIYGGKILGDDMVAESGIGGAVYVSGGGRMYINSGSITGSTAVSGGAIYSTGTVTIAGGTVTGGTATSGGAIYSAGTLTMTGGTVTGGTATNGGAIYSAGTLTMTGGTVTDGVANDGKNEGCGGNIYITGDGSATLSGGLVQNGQAGDYDSETLGGYGGNIYVNSGGTLEICSGVKISGGKAPNNGGSIHVADGTTFEMSGGWIENGKTRDQGGNLFLNTPATITGGTITGGQAGSGGNLALGNSSAGVSVTLRNVTVSSGTATNTGGNVRVQNHYAKAATNLTIEEGTTITGGQAGEKGGNIYVACDLTVSGGLIELGTADHASEASYGGNIYITNTGELDVTLTVSGGTIRNGTVSNQTTTVSKKAYGGNIYAACTNTEISGGTISGGKAYNGKVDGVSTKSSWGGNIYCTGSMELSGSAVIENGYCDYNTGNIQITGSSFTMSGGSIIGGHGVNSTGNLYISSNTTATISSGSITGGKNGAGEGVTTGGTANIYVVSGTLDLSGGTIDGGVNVFSHSGQANLSLSGSPVVSGTGIVLSHAADSSNVYYGIGVTLDLPSLQSGTGSVVLRYTGFHGDYADGLLLAAATSGWTSHPYERVARQVLLDYTGSNACEISYEDDGIYIRKSTDKSQKWTCLCGANYGQAHMTFTDVDGDNTVCDHFDVMYSPWTKNYLPNKPGYWYMAGRTTTTNAAGVEYVKGLSQSSISFDYYVDSDGNYQAVRTVRALSTAGSTMTDSDGKPVSVVDYVTRYSSTGGVPSYAATVGASTAAQTVAYITDSGATFTKGAITPLTEYSIFVDLNGYKLEVATDTRGINFNTTGSKEINGVTYYYYRDAEVSLNILDSSEKHTGALATYGVYSEVEADGTQTAYSRGGTQYQGKLIWMPHNWDALNTSYATLDASSTITGIGLVVYNGGGRVTLNNSTVIGGTSQGFYRTDNGKLGTTDVTGGGAISVFDGGVLTVNGGTVKNGKSIFRNMLYNIDGTLYTATGRTYEQAVGGGNIFIKDGTLNLNDATVTGGWALICDGTEVSHLPSYSYGSGGGIYVLKGKVNISGNTVINGNYCGKISSTLLTDSTQTAARNFYGVVDVYNATITSTAKNDLFMGGNPLALHNLTGEVHFRMQGFAGDYGKGTGTYASYNLSSGGYIGTVATYTGTAPTANNLICDDWGEPEASFVVENGKVYYPWSETLNGVTYSGDDAYAIGYGKVCIQPNLVDLQGGFNMTNYGPNRWTNELYSPSGSLYSQYYDITSDSKGYFDDWDTKCYATALATTDGEGDTVIILALDAQTHSDAVADQVKRMVSYATGVPQDNISLSSAHQHSIPGPTVRYKTYEGTDGLNYYELDSNGKAVVLADYSTEFYSGIVKAAVNAMADRQQSTVEVGKLQTTADGKQYNFVRNVKLYNGSTQNASTFLGMVTDNHHDLVKYGDYWYVAGKGTTTSFSSLTKYVNSNVSLAYESNLDTTMQLVRYHQLKDDYDIIMANFRTHPHRGSGASSYYVHSDVVGAFRYNLEQTYKNNGNSRVVALYFSGGGGNVNTTTYSTGLTDNTVKYPEYGMTLETASATAELQKLEKASIWGQELAKMTYNFLENKTTYSGSTKMTAVSGSNNVEVAVENVACTIKPSDATATAIKNATGIRDWATGNYVTEFVGFGSAAGSTTYGNWFTYVGKYSNAADRVYSSFDSNNIRRALLWQEAGYTYEELNLTAYAMGEIGFIAAPYEMFQENDSQIRSLATDYKMTIVSTLANGSNGYIPSAAGFDNGGYSTDQSRYAKGTGEDLAKKFANMLNGLK